MTQDFAPEPDLASERGVLAGLCKFGAEAWADVGDLLRVESFTLDSNQVLWKCLGYAFTEMRAQRIDVPTIYSAARSIRLADFLQNPEEKRHLQAVLKYPIELASLRSLARKVRKLDVARELLEKTREIQDSLSRVTGDESIDRLLAMAVEPLHSYTVGLASGIDRSGPTMLGDGAVEYFRNKLDNPVQSVGMPTGFPRYDRAIGGGLRRGEIDLIVARQKTGKSLLAINIALTIAIKYGIPVLYVDTEMMARKQLDRAAASLARLDKNCVETGNVPRHLWPRLEEAAAIIQESPLAYEYVKGLPPDDIISRMRRWAIRRVGVDDAGRFNPCVIVYDWFKLMDAGAMGRHMAEHQVLGYLIDSVKGFLEEYGIPCLMFGQQNREGLDYEDTRSMRGSDRIIDTVSSFSIFKEKDDEKLEPGERPADGKYTHKLMPIICRNGPGLKQDYINVETDYSCAFLAEGPTRNELFHQSGGKLKGLSYEPVQPQQANP